MTAKRWKRRPDGSNWGDFGPDDQIGRLNLITRERRRRALAEAREGHVFCLSLPLDFPGGNYHNLGRRPPRLHPVQKDGRVKYNLRANARHTDVFCDDTVELSLQFSTQWDALAHVGTAFDADGDGEAEIVYYNGYRGGVDIAPPAAASARSAIPAMPTNASVDCPLPRHQQTMAVQVMVEREMVERVMVRPTPIRWTRRCRGALRMAAVILQTTSYQDARTGWRQPALETSRGWAE